MLRSNNSYGYSDRRRAYIKTTSGGSLELIVTPDLNRSIFLFSCGGYSDKKTTLTFFDDNNEFLSFSVNGSFIFDLNGAWYCNYEKELKIRLDSLISKGSIGLSYVLL